MGEGLRGPLVGRELERDLPVECCMGLGVEVVGFVEVEGLVGLGLVDLVEPEGWGVV